MKGERGTKELSITPEDLLQYAVEHDMLNVAQMRMQLEMDKRRELLERHPYAVWHNEKEDRWYTDVPVFDSKTGKKRVKRKDRHDLDLDIIEYTLQFEEEKKNYGIRKCTLRE